MYDMKSLVLSIFICIFYCENDVFGGQDKYNVTTTVNCKVREFWGILESEKVSKFGNFRANLVEFLDEKVPFCLYFCLTAIHAG